MEVRKGLKKWETLKGGETSEDKDNYRLSWGVTTSALTPAMLTFWCTTSHHRLLFPDSIFWSYFEKCFLLWGWEFKDLKRQHWRKMREVQPKVTVRATPPWRANSHKLSFLILVHTNPEHVQGKKSKTKPHYSLFVSTMLKLKCGSFLCKLTAFTFVPLRSEFTQCWLSLSATSKKSLFPRSTALKLLPVVTYPPWHLNCDALYVRQEWLICWSWREEQL